MLKEILHTGVEVANLEQAVNLYESLGYTVTNQFHKPEPSAEVVMIQKGETKFELWQFNNAAHPQVTFIRNHIAIYSDALEEDLVALEKQGYKITIPVTEGVILRYGFVQDQAGANYEIATDK